jgi:hypothetical protein
MFVSVSCTRIIVLALIPVGLSATALPMSRAQETSVGHRHCHPVCGVADASRDFKSAVAPMRLVVRDFSVSPDDNLVVNLSTARAAQTLDTIAIDHKHPRQYRDHAQRRL